VEHNLTLSKIINDPVHGFIEIPRGLILDVIDTPIFQRLRRIKQLGQSSMVYPGGLHNRFSHALGAMHLMRQALDTLRTKNVDISEQEYEGALLAVLLHDIGHGPFSHALEFAILDLHHERMSLALMRFLNELFSGQLTTAIEIFEGRHPKRFLHQLVSSQLDMDRMDYLIRDSFFTGVVEGVVGIDRIIKTLNVCNGDLVVESKGIYSVEKFVVARRLMYWQVYLHKTALVAECMVVNALTRARHCFEHGIPIFLDEHLHYFFANRVDSEGITEEVIEQFVQLDDTNIEFAIKQWCNAPDRVLADLCKRLLNRDLFKIKLQTQPFLPDIVADYRQMALDRLGMAEEAVHYYVFTGQVSNQAYLKNSDEPIYIWFKNRELVDLTTASDMQNILALSSPVVKHYLCHPAV
jgi:uncharacterized protein